MISGGLKFEQAPPLSVPLRFFLTAPVFAILAALVALWQGPEIYESRWSPATLALTHLLTLGFAAMVMVGALMQILPVLAGAPIRSPRLIAAFSHAGLTLGTLALAGGFLLAEPALLKCAVPLLGLAFGAFLAAMGTSLFRAPLVNDAVAMLRLVALALAVTVALGLWLAASRGWGIALPSGALRDLHPAWGFVGWIGLLLAGVAYRVVPMFQMTPPYPGWMSRKLGLAALAALVLWSFAAWFDERPFVVAGAVALAALIATFVATTAWLQSRRRRRLPDVTLLFWRLAILSSLLGALLWAASAFREDAPAGLAVLLGIIAIAGATLSFICGMLYKIVPFLAWFHLQARTAAGRPIPNVRQYLSETAQRRHFWLHAMSVSLLIAAISQPSIFGYPAALAFGASAVQLLVNLLAVARAYRRESALCSSAASAGERPDVKPA